MVLFVALGVVLVSGGIWYMSSKPPVLGPTGAAASTTIRLISPKGGEVFQIGSTYKIQWESENVPQGSRVALTINTGGGSDVFQDDLPLVGSYDWTVPSYIGIGDVMLPAVGDKYQIKAEILQGPHTTHGPNPPGFPHPELIASSEYSGFFSIVKPELPVGFTGKQYSVALPIRGITAENLGTAVDPKKLPPGLALKLIELPCAPQTIRCTPQPYLIGVPSRSGNYQFIVTIPSMQIGYSVTIK